VARVDTVGKPKPQRTHNIKARGRGPGEGTIYKRVDRRTKSDGTVVEVERWCALVDLGFQSGRRVRKIIYGHTRGEVADKLATALADRRRGLEPIVNPARMTLADWLQLWLADVVKRERRPNTYTLYEETARRHIVPILGRKRLTSLRRKDVEAWIRDRERTGLAPRTIHRLWAVLHSALEYAVRCDQLSVNPAGRPSLPRVENEEPRTLSREHVRRLIAALVDEPDRALYALELATGMREGEILGLRWADDETCPGLDLDRAEVRVFEQLQRGELAPLKRGASRRVLHLRPWVLDLLRDHRDEELVKRRLSAAQHWREHGLVFPSRVGTPRKGSNLWLSWKRLLKRAGLPDYKFHELRHTAASLALAEGASLFHVSRMLGHSSISITADTYGHWTDEGRQEVAQRLERALLGDVSAEQVLRSPLLGSSASADDKPRRDNGV
jgi:integrase